MKLKINLLSFILGLTISGAVISTPLDSSQDSVDEFGRLSISEEMTTTEGENGICPLSDMDAISSK